MLTEQEFQTAVERHLDMIYRIALNATRQTADAEDAAQTVMLRLWQTDTNFESEDHLRHWLVKVTVNVCHDMAKSLWRRHTVSMEACGEISSVDAEQNLLLQEVMDLAPKYRLPLYLYYYEGYHVAEIGELLDLKVSTVQTRLARGREVLKRQLEE